MWRGVHERVEPDFTDPSLHEESKRNRRGSDSSFGNQAYRDTDQLEKSYGDNGVKSKDEEREETRVRNGDNCAGWTFVGVSKDIVDLSESPNARADTSEGEATNKHKNVKDTYGFARSIRLFSTIRPRLTAWILVILLLGLWGFWAGPRWNPEPLRSSVVSEVPDTTITVANPTAQIGTYEVQRRDVEVSLRDGAVIKARIIEPVGFEGLAPSLTFIHGTGTIGVDSFDTVARWVASTGVVTIVPEKRIDNYTLTHRDYKALANDYEDVFTYVSRRENVDPKRSGLYAVSEGCFIAPIIASRNPAVAHVSFISAPVLPIRSQGALAADTYLRNLGAPETMIRAISRLIGQQFGDDFQYVDFNVSKYQEKMTMPVFMLYGTGDMSMPMVQGVEIMRDDLERARNRQLTVRYYRGADHGLKVKGEIEKNAIRDVSDWINGLPYSASADPRIAGAEPIQKYRGQRIASAPKFASGMQLVWTIVAGLALIIVSILLILVGRVRVRGRPLVDAGSLGKLSAATGTTVVLAWVALVAYVMALAYYATSYQHNTLVVQGGWVIVQAIAFLAAWLLVAFVHRWFKNHARVNTLGAVALGIGLLGNMVLIVLLAYWGPYPSVL